MPFSSTISRRLVPGVLLIVALTTGCHKTTFERAQAQAEAGNPHWLSIELDTADKRHTYKAGEPVMFTVAYSSAVGKFYKAEIAEGASTVAATDRLHISDGRLMPLQVYGIVCCDSKIIGLNDDPYIYRPHLQVYLKPGKYEFYVTTHRIFPWDITGGVYEPSEWETASNLLKIRVVADPGWQERALARIRANPASLSDPKVCMTLLMLDIPAATEQKLANIRNGIKCRPVNWFQGAFDESEYPAALRAMDEMMRAPTFGVTQTDVDLILAMRNNRMHPELQYAPSGREAFEQWQAAAKPVFLAGQKHMVRELCELLPTKTPDALKITQQTIDGMTRPDEMRDAGCR